MTGAELAELKAHVRCLMPTVGVRKIGNRVYIFDAYAESQAISMDAERASQFPAVLDAVLAGLRKTRVAVNPAAVFGFLRSDTPAARTVAAKLGIRDWTPLERATWRRISG